MKSMLKNDEVGVVNCFVLGDSMNEKERLMEIGRRLAKESGYADDVIETVVEGWVLRKEEAEITAKANDMESLD